MEKSTILLIIENCNIPRKIEGIYLYEFSDDNCIEILDNGIRFYWYDKDDFGGDSAPNEMIIGEPLYGRYSSYAPPQNVQICTEADIVWYLQNTIFKLF